jgi:hypothetical protein
MSNLPSAVPEALEPSADELHRLQHDLTAMMLRYNQAFDACDEIPQLDVLPVLKSFWQLLAWSFSLEFAFFTLWVDLPLLLIRKIYGRPHFLLGRVFYRVIMWPFRAAWAGETPALKLVRIRYLSRLLMFYHAQLRMDALHRSFNARHLRLLAEATASPEVLDEAENLQSAFDLFAKLTADRYEISALVVFGPLVTILSVLTQKFLLPTLDGAFVWFRGLFGQQITQSLTSPTFLQNVFGAIVFLVFYAGFLLVSVWMDMRKILKQANTTDAEQRAFATGGIKMFPDIPIDLIAFFLFSVAATYAAVWLKLNPDTFLGRNFAATDPDSQSGFIVFAVGCTILSLIALYRRTGNVNWLLPAWFKRRGELPLEAYPREQTEAKKV